MITAEPAAAVAQLTVTDLTIQYSSGTSPITAGEDFSVTAKVDSLCKLSCSTIAFRLHYKTIWGDTRVVERTLSHKASQNVSLVIPGAHIYWWNSATRTPYVFGYWMTATQKQGTIEVYTRNPIASNSMHERQVRNRLQAVVRDDSGAPIADLAWILRLITMDPADDVEQPDIAEGSTGSGGLIQLDIGFGSGVAAAAAANHQEVTLLLTAGGSPPSSPKILWGEMSFHANFGNPEQPPGVVPPPIIGGPLEATGARHESAVQTAEIPAVDCPSVMTSGGSGDEDCVRSNLTHCVTKAAEDYHYHNHGQRAGKLSVVNYGYGLSTGLTIGEAKRASNWVQLAIKATGPWAPSQAAVHVARAHDEASEIESGYWSKHFGPRAVFYEPQTYWDIIHERKWRFYADHEELPGSWGTCVYERRHYPVNWNPFGKAPAFGDFDNEMSESAWFNDDVEQYSTQAQYFHVSYNVPFKRVTGFASSASRSFCLFICVGNTVQYQKYQAFVVPAGQDDCADGWFLYPHGSSTLGDTPVIYVDSGAPGPAVKSNDPNVPKGC